MKVTSRSVMMLGLAAFACLDRNSSSTVLVRPAVDARAGTTAPRAAAHPFDAAAARQELLRRDAEWADAAAGGKDLDRIVSYWTEDALVIEPGQPVYEGKAAIRAYVAESLRTPGFKIHWVSEKPAFSPDGEMAWMRGVDEITVPGPGGALLTQRQRGISIWRLEPDGLWRCVADIANQPPTANEARNATRTKENAL